MWARVRVVGARVCFSLRKAPMNVMSFANVYVNTSNTQSKILIIYSFFSFIENCLFFIGINYWKYIPALTARTGVCAGAAATFSSCFSSAFSADCDANGAGMTLGWGGEGDATPLACAGRPIIAFRAAVAAAGSKWYFVRRKKKK